MLLYSIGYSFTFSTQVCVPEYKISTCVCILNQAYVEESIRVSILDQDYIQD
jgi:hypothetical protein